MPKIPFPQKWILFLFLLATAFVSASCFCGPWMDEEDDEWGDFHHPPDDDGGVDPSDCGACHVGEMQAWENESSHKALYSCTYCHIEADPVPGIGHHAKPWCDDCHSEKTHIPVYNYDEDDFRLMSCVTCHNPHGSKNSYLIQEQVLVDPDRTKPIDFRNTVGLAEGSYAEPGENAGAGLCEVCHTGTKYYNRFGTGLDHFTTRCTDCHSHADGFPL